MKTLHHLFAFFMSLFLIGNANAQNSLTAFSNTEIIVRNNPLKAVDPAKLTTATERKQNRVVAITGVRFAYPLVQKWIDDYNKINPDIQIIIEARGSRDPDKYDVLIEAYEPETELKNKHDYLYVARYAILPVANSHSSFAKAFSDKGLNQSLIKKLFFHDIFSEKKEEVAVKVPYTIYTRLQKAGAPITFSKYFGYQQNDIKGKAIAGADEHLLKALLRDTTGLSYLPLNLLYDQKTGKPAQGLTILPVDLNGNGKVSDDEKFYDDLVTVVNHLEEKTPRAMNNIPIGYLNFSLTKDNSSPETKAFLQWVLQNGQNDLHAFGFLKPEQARLEEEKQDEFVSKNKR